MRLRLGLLLAATLFLLSPRAARAEDLGRAALALGAIVTTNRTPTTLSDMGFHLGGEVAYHLGFIGPVLSFDLDRLGGRAGEPPTWLGGMGAGLRAFLLRPHLPVALYADVQGVVVGTSNPIGNRFPYDSSFLGVAAGLGIEWVQAVSTAVAARVVQLAEGPGFVTLSLVVGIGAP